ncbi:unnamed protein product, partial [Linum tenue]
DIYTVTVIPDCVPEKVAYLKERVGTLVFQPHYTIHSCGGLCTYSLYEGWFPSWSLNHCITS